MVVDSRIGAASNANRYHRALVLYLVYPHLLCCPCGDWFSIFIIDPETLCDDSTHPGFGELACPVF